LHWKPHSREEKQPAQHYNMKAVHRTQANRNRIESQSLAWDWR
jgi:hypothetical protein